ncbi:GNAT family N-acetyltransferase [Catenisphaera adipataccumulans]|jgi:ribosomal protein S18 acetylase RimI-like enzyme|uniref:Ribosomal protein S18 acetylase RimI-like enzyme n=1 Tax=Catenisphaera adipataccumulans TaxID=700500 RepID=A0A7W8CZ81_9FIRM|nr:GNAT family N-acetyltransferase [Catenisphaera adipataccumulans]MBB5183017.1 ribosomal protein S18 acetylase RimI-like enzyme [Catenisphaera adipataccumulans]
MIRVFNDDDIFDMTRIWNDAVLENNSIPQTETMSEQEAMHFFSDQYTAVYEENGKIAGLYILHPNNIGHCGHIANATYVVDKKMRGRHIGEQLVNDCLVQAKELGYSILQFNAVVCENVHAVHLYERLGFVNLGRIPGGYRNKEGDHDIYVMYQVL